MGKIENDEIRKRKNNHFIQAFEYVANCLSMTQGQLAKSIGSKTAYISNFRKGLRPVPEDTIEGLIRISATKPGLQIFSEYLYGYSDIMLLSNVSDEEMVAAKRRHDNPDYDKIEKTKSADIHQHISPSNTLDISSLINAALAAKDEIIRAKEEVIRAKEETIKEKEINASLRKIIEDLKRENDLLRNQLNKYQAGDILDNHPFPIGVADAGNNNNKEQART